VSKWKKGEGIWKEVGKRENKEEMHDRNVEIMVNSS
jgi:hypothetical protein